MELLGLRYQWFLALEQPFSTARLAAPAHLARFGFLVNDDAASNPDRLPVGFTQHRDRDSGEEMLDLTCATCHSGQLNYRGRGVRIDGGAGMHDMNKFLEELVSSLTTTYVLPWKFDHFAQKVLGVKYPEGECELRAAFGQTVRRFLAQGITQWYHGQSLTQDGFGRTDALGRINNALLADRLQTPANYRVADAPVNFPHLWDIWRFDWAQWNGSIHQAMMRNAGTALGLEAPVALFGPDGQLLPESERYQSTVRVADLHCIETTLEQLRPPRWPEDIFGPIDRAKAARGKEIYRLHCASCHDPQPAAATCQGLTYTEWRVPLFPVSQIGTDPRAADNFANWTVDISKLDPSDPKLRDVSAAEGLRYITERVTNRKYDELGLSPAQRERFDGLCRRDDIQAPLQYRARPLDGAWATPPFLHNGSVPNLYQLLLPAAQRETIFYTGNLEFDPHVVGYVSKRFWGGTRFDTRAIGNGNAGHEYGTAVGDDERWALIEYLKILGTDEQRPAPPEPPQCGERSETHLTDP